jgi:hypothetical protein
MGKAAQATLALFAHGRKLTIAQIAEQLGVSCTIANNRVQRLIEAGELKSDHSVRPATYRKTTVVDFEETREATVPGARMITARHTQRIERTTLWLRPGIS